VKNSFDAVEGESPMAQYEIVVSDIDLDFSTHTNEIPPDGQSQLVSFVLGKKWILAVEAEEKLTGPLCQQVSNETGCLVRDVTFTAKKLA
jgi:hypothetical protein